MATSFKQVLELVIQGGDTALATLNKLEDGAKRFRQAFEKGAEGGGDSSGSPVETLAQKTQRAASGIGAATTQINSAFRNLGISLERVGLYQIGLNRQLATSAVNIANLGVVIGGAGTGFIELGQQTGGVAGALSIVSGWLLTVTTRAAALTAGVGALGAALMAMGQNAARSVNGLSQLADKAGVSLSDFQNIKAAAAAKGVDQEAAASGMERLRNEAIRAAAAYDTLQQKISAARDPMTGVIKDQKLAAEAHDLYTSKVSESASILEKVGVQIRGYSGGEAQTARLLESLGRAIADLSGRGTADAANKIRELKQLLGSDFYRVAALGSEAIKKYGAEVDKLAPKIKDQFKVEQQIIKMNILKEALGRLSTQMGLALLPAAVKGTSAFTQWLSNNQGVIKQIESLLESAGKSVANFFKILEGNQQARAESPWIATIVDGFRSAKQFVEEWADRLKTILPDVTKAFEGIKNKINETFGTNLTGKEMIVIGMVGRMIGAFGILWEAGKFVFNGIGNLIVTQVVREGLSVMGTAIMGLISGPLKVMAASFAVTFLYADKITGPWERLKLRIEIAIETARQWIAVLKMAAELLPGTGNGIKSKAFAEAKADYGNATNQKELLQRQLEIESLPGKYSGMGVGEAAVARAKDSVDAVFRFLKSQAPEAVDMWDRIVTPKKSLLDQQMPDYETQLRNVMGGNLVNAPKAGGTVPGYTDSIGRIYNQAGEVIGRVETSSQNIAASTQQTAGAVAATSSSMSTAASGAETFASGSERGRDAWIQIDQIVTNLGGKVQAITPQISGGGGSGGGGGIQLSPMASGGLITGPGTGTSDSIPIWSSAGEFVVKAAAVAKYGVGVFHALNSMMLPNGLFGARRFADGGLVTSTPMPAGSAEAQRPVNIVLDGRSYGGFSGSSSVVDALDRHASTRRMSSTTKRAPSRIG